MRRLTFLLTFATAAAVLTAAQPATQRATEMLTVNSNMRGPALVGSAPSAVRWSSDSTTIYFNWQKPGEQRSSTWAVGRDGSGLRQLAEEQARDLDVPRTGAFDRAGRRVLVVESGDIVMYDRTSGDRRQLTRTSGTESSPRWARQDSAITFVRDGDLFLLGLDGEQAGLLQLTDIRTAEAGAGRAGGAGERGRGAGGSRAGEQGAARAGEQTAAQQWLRQQERDLFEYIRRLAEQGGRGRGGGRGGCGPAGADVLPIPHFDLGPRQSVNGLMLSGDGRYVWIGVTEQPTDAARGQDTPNYVTESAYPEMIPGRPNVGDSQSRRLGSPSGS